MKRREFLQLTVATAPFTVSTLSAQERIRDNANRAIRLRPGADRTDEPYRLGVGHMECKVSAKDTGGAMSVFEALTYKPDRPVKHLHHDQDEWFYVIEGEYQLHVGDEKFRLSRGDSVFAPRKIPHVWACISEKPGRLMVAFQPAGTMEQFFRELPKYLANRASPEELQKLNRAHRMEVLGPRLLTD